MSLSFFRWRNLKRRIWFPVACYGLLGVVAALFALSAKYWLPNITVIEVGAKSVSNILQILATSMLAVATFSLTTMVTAYGNAASGATPRASRLLVEDETAQRAIGTFIGSFVYAIVSIIALATGFYGVEGRFILFLTTIVVIVMIVATLVRWIDRLSNIGQLNEVIILVEKATQKPLHERARYPYLRCQPKSGPSFGCHLMSTEARYVNFIDFSRLQELAEEHQCKITIESAPGAYVYTDSPLATISVALADDKLDALRACFVMGSFRTYDQDPRHGLIVLSQIGMRALSPAVNDPGTAIDVLATLNRLLNDYALQTPDEKVEFDRLYMSALAPEDLLEDSFTGIARHSTEFVEVQIRLHKILRSLSDDKFFHSAAKAFAKDALAKTLDAMGPSKEYDRVRAISCGPAT